MELRSGQNIDNFQNISQHFIKDELLTSNWNYVNPRIIMIAGKNESVIHDCLHEQHDPKWWFFCKKINK